MIWVKIEEFKGNYEVSDTGLVRSVARVEIRSNGWRYPVIERIMKPSLTADGYERVGLMLSGKLVTRSVHRLVAKAFIANTSNKPQVNHLSGVKTENNVENLEWCTSAENVRHAFDNGLAFGLRGSKNPSAKIDEMQALTIKTLISAKFKLVKISKELGISINIVKDISRGKTWKHL